MWDGSPAGTKARSWMLSPMSRTGILSPSLCPHCSALERYCQCHWRWCWCFRAARKTATRVKLTLVFHISTWKDYLSEFTRDLNFACCLLDKCNPFLEYIAYPECCFIFSLHDLRSLQCANAITPADQKSNPLCAFQGALHIFAGHAVALLGTSTVSPWLMK